MSKNKNPKPVSSRYLTFFGGVFFCLLSVSMIINIGDVNRALTIGPNFLFGVSSFIIYIFLYILGVSFLFREKGIKIRFSFTFFGVLVFFLGSLILTSLIFNVRRTEGVDVNTFITMFQNMVSNDKIGYFNYDQLNLFTNISYLSGTETLSYGFGGGLAGNALTAVIITYLGTTWAWIIAIFLSVSGVALYAIPFIKKAVIKSRKQAKENEERKIQQVTSNLTSIESSAKTMITKDDYVGVVNSVSLVKSAGQYDFHIAKDKETHSPLSPSLKPAFGGKINADSNPSILNNYPNDGGFVKARFARPDLAEQTPEEKEAEIEVMSGEAALLEANAKQTHAEQLMLDFDSKPVINRELAQSKPVFVERKVVSNNSQINEQQISPSSNEEPMIKKPLKWIAPSHELLDTLETTEALETNQKVANERSQLIDQALSDFNIGANVIDYTIGPSVTRFNIRYESNVSSRSINNLVDDLSRRLGGVAARFEPVVEGQIYSGLEIPNATITPVGFKEVYEKLPDVKKHPLAIAFGKNISGDVISADFDEFPHILVAGTSGSGKSIFIHSLITTLIMRNSPEQLRMAIIDPKRVEMVRYRDMPHLLCPIVSDSSQASLFLNKLVEEMNERYAMFEEAGGCTSVAEYNEYADECHKSKIPYIIVIIDEYGDLVTTHKEVAQPILLLGQKARACGIHLLISTQSPTTSVITGTIKSNLATHVALATANVTQSITILGEGGAEKLLGKGDMLVQSPLVSRVGLVRLQCCFIQRKEILRVVGYLKEHYPTNYSERFLNLEQEAAQAGQNAIANGSVNASLDPAEEAKYQGIKEWVMGQQYMSMSRIQGECAVGFNRARRFFTRLQQEGIVANEVEGNKGCRVIVHDLASREESLPSSDDYSSIG